MFRVKLFAGAFGARDALLMRLRLFLVRMMVFGHNSNIKMGAHTFHVQTEDRGINHALIDTTVYFQGRVLHRRTNNYLDLLPLTEDTQQALKLRVNEQHRTVLEEIRSGELELTIPPSTLPGANARADHAPEAPANIETPAVAAQTRKWVLELRNARTWLAGKQATLHVSVNEEGGGPVRGESVSAEIEGGEAHPAYTARTGDDGQATISFEMPKLTGSEAALVIRTGNGTAGAHLRFTLRAKPRVPAV